MSEHKKALWNDLVGVLSGMLSYAVLIDIVKSVVVGCAVYVFFIFFKSILKKIKK